MNPTGKAGRPRNEPPDLKGETQFQRFVETAVALDADDDGAQFFRAMDVLAPSATKKRVATAQPPDLTEMPKKRTIEGRARKKQ